MPDLVWPLYLALFLAIIPTGICAKTTLYHRVTICCLGLAVMFFGTGRMLYWSNPASLACYEWIFTLAHWTFATFVVLNIHAAHTYRKHGERL